MSIGMALRRRWPERVAGASLASDLTIPAAVYSTFMVVTGGTFAWAMSRRNSGTPAGEPGAPLGA